MTNERERLSALINKTSEIEKLLTAASGTGFPRQKTVWRTIYDKPEFVLWKNQLKYKLQEAPQDQLIQETVDLLDKGFSNGFTDEKDFRELKAKLNLITEHADRYDIVVEAAPITETVQAMKKGTKIKTAFDEYTLIKQIGSGGNGRVFSAINNAGEQVAIKLLERDIGKDKLKRFKNEISFCEQHHHKNVVSILDRGYAYLDGKDYVFYVMPLYADTLKSRIKAGISPEDAVSIFVGILEGLKYAHEHNAIHRDIKPENILFEANSNVPVICDFGIAHFAEEDLKTVIETKPGDRMANFYYAAPEQYKRGVVTTPQTDVYAAGLILNEMFTNEIPQAAGYKRIADINADYGYLDNVVEQLYRQEPTERLYPEERIISEMKLLAERNKKEKEKARLQSVINELIDPGEFEAKIIKREYKDGELIFAFDTVLPNEWYQFIAFGSYSCSWMMGYEHEKLKKISNNELAMQLHRTENADSVKSIMDNVEDWVRTTNHIYSQNQKRKALAEHQRKEAERKAEIDRIEKETAFASMISELL